MVGRVNVDPVPIALELWRRSRLGNAPASTVFGSPTPGGTHTEHGEQHQISIEMLP